MIEFTSALRLNRRRLLAAGAALALPGSDRAFTFPLLGDLHFDRLEHHDMAWLEREKPNDVAQVRNYSRLTETVLPRLFAEVREQIAAAALPVPFVVHVGDFVEGLCGTPDLARVHCQDAVTFVREARLGAPFLFTKGNHDITGPGAPEAFDAVLLPFLAAEARQELRDACYVVEHRGATFVYFDAYRRESLPWLEATLARQRPSLLFLVIHPPVVPYGARSTWHVYAAPSQQEARDRLLRLLGRHRAIVLSGHLHKYSVLVRSTEEGAFLQLAVSSVIPQPEEEPRTVLEGRGAYTPDQVQVEPRFQPETEAERRARLAEEAPTVRHFQYADAPGYAWITVRERRVTAQIYTGLGGRRWRELDLTALLAEAAARPAGWRYRIA